MTLRFPTRRADEYLGQQTAAAPTEGEMAVAAGRSAAVARIVILITSFTAERLGCFARAFFWPKEPSREVVVEHELQALLCPMLALDVRGEENQIAFSRLERLVRWQ